jgi:hypothetical protein
MALIINFITGILTAFIVSIPSEGSIDAIRYE